MITNDGIEIISKFLAGQASSYASYIAIGSGARVLSNNNSIGIGGGTISNVLGSGPYTATVTTSANYLSYINVGDTITSVPVIPPNTGTLGTGVVTVTAITGQKTFTVSSTASISSGAVSDMYVSNNISSKTLETKTSLDFEMARFPITSRSYVVDKQIASATTIMATAANQVVITTSNSHPFGIGDILYVTDVNNTAYNGMYTITATTSTTITAVPYDSSIGNFSPLNTAYSGYAYNNNLFNVTVYTKQISLTAEIPDIGQYDVTELGLYSIGSNQYSTSGDSRMLLGFDSSESWKYYNNSTQLIYDVPYPPSMTPMPLSSEPFFASSNDAYWISNPKIILRGEKPRNGSDSLIIPGNMSVHDGTSFNKTTSNYIMLNNPGVDLSKTSDTDILKIAYSIVDAKSTTTDTPTYLRLQLEFICSNGIDSKIFKFSPNGSPNIVTPNRYIVSSISVSSGIATSGFKWSDVSSVKIYAAIQNSNNTATSDFALALDGFRFENTSTVNPLYALTAYTIVNNADAYPLSKKSNTKELINFRLDLAVGK